MKSSASLALAQWALLLALLLALALALRPPPTQPPQPSPSPSPRAPHDRLQLWVAVDLCEAQRPQLQTSIKQPPGAAHWTLHVSSSCPGPAACTVTLHLTSPQTQLHSHKSEDQRPSDDTQEPPPWPQAEINQLDAGNRPPERHDTHTRSQYSKGDYAEKDRVKFASAKFSPGPPGISPEPRRLSHIDLYKENLHSGTNPLLHPQGEHTRHLYHQSHPQPRPCLEPICQSQPWWQQREQSQIHRRIVSHIPKESASFHSNLHPLAQEQAKYITDQAEAGSYQQPGERYLQPSVAKAEAPNKSHQYQPEFEPQTDRDCRQNKFSYQPQEEQNSYYEQYQPELEPEESLNLPPQYSSEHENKPQYNTQEQVPAGTSQEPMTIQQRLQDHKEYGTLSRE